MKKLCWRSGSQAVVRLSLGSRLWDVRLESPFRGRRFLHRLEEKLGILKPKKRNRLC